MRTKLDEDSGIPCEGCRVALATHSSSSWPSHGHLQVHYWCRGCAPSDAEPFVDEDGFFIEEEPEPGVA